MEQTSKSFFSKKSTLYATFQFLGWGTLFLMFLLQHFPNVGFTFLLDVFLTVFSLFLISHLFRKFTQRRDWLKMMVGQLVPRILLSSIVLSLFALPVQVMWSFILWRDNINGAYSGTNAEIFAELFFVFIQGAVLFFFWQVFYFLYHYVSNYNKNLKMEAMVNEFELNKLKS